MLEKMSDFFENRLDGYDEHMLTCIEAAREFYPYTAHCLPKKADCYTKLRNALKDGGYFI